MKNVVFHIIVILLLSSCGEKNASNEGTNGNHKTEVQHINKVEANGIIIEYTPSDLRDISQTNRLIFEAAYSRILGKVEVIIRSAKFKLERSDDFNLCFSLPLNDFSDPYKNDKFVLDDNRYSHILISDTCVVVSAISQLENNIVISEKAPRKFNIIRKSSGELLSEKVSYYALWQMFGEEHPEVDLWADNGMLKLPDKVTSDQLVRSINAGGRYLDAAIEVVYRRQKSIIDNAHSLIMDKKDEGVKVIQHQETSPEVIEAFLETNLLANGIMNEREKMMNIFLAKSAKPYDQQVLEQLFLGLDREVEDNRGDAEKDYKKKTEKTLNITFGSPEGRPAYMTPRYLEMGALLALELGDKAIASFAEKYKSIIVNNIMQNLADFKVISVLAARSEYGEKLIMDLLNKVEFEQKVIPVIQTRIQDLILNRKERSIQLDEIIKVRCNSPNSFFPNGDKDRAMYFCTKLIEPSSEK